MQRNLNVYFWLHHLMINTHQLFRSSKIKKVIVNFQCLKHFEPALLWSILIIKHLFYFLTIEFCHPRHLLSNEGVQLVQIKSS